MTNETFAASAAKVAGVNTGAVLSMATSTGTVGTVAGILAATYSAIQIVKSLPWLTDYIMALIAGARGNWSHWRGIAKKEEKANGDTQP